MTDKRKLGNYGERKVRQYLRKRGYKIVQSNYTAKYGEIDVIAIKKEIIAFVEVKTRSENPMVNGIYAVNRQKQQRIIKTAKRYMSQSKTQLQPRFDVAEVEVVGRIIKKAKINYIKNAY